MFGEWQCRSRLSWGGGRAGYSLCGGLQRHEWGEGWIKAGSITGEGGRSLW